MTGLVSSGSSVERPRRGRFGDLCLKALEYGRYSLMAMQAGFPLRHLPNLRGAVNLIDAASRIDRGAPLSIVDVGANVGDWSFACVKVFPRAEVLSIEPVPEFFRAVARRAADHPRWRTVQVAVGANSGALPIAVQGPRSSLKRLAGDEFPDWAVGSPVLERTELVTVEPLDAVLAKHKVVHVDVLKIDAEGFENEILEGAHRSLAMTDQVLIEVRFHELFSGGALFPEVHKKLVESGFALMHLKPCRGQCLWADATYAKRAVFLGDTSV